MFSSNENASPNHNMADLIQNSSQNLGYSAASPIDKAASPSPYSYEPLGHPTYESEVSKVGTLDPRTTYHVDLKVHYKTKFGESICILGSIPELGMWKDFKCHMRWTDGHIWVTEKPLVTNRYFFQYKYVLLDKERSNLIAWERGVDRIADLEILPKVLHSNTHKFYDFSSGLNLQSERAYDTIKKVELNDEWEAFNVCFSVSHPVDDFHDEMILSGDQPNTNHMQMHKIPRSISWMEVKYGQQMVPYEVTVKFDNVMGDNFGQWK